MLFSSLNPQLLSEPGRALELVVELSGSSSVRDELRVVRVDRYCDADEGLALAGLLVSLSFTINQPLSHLDRSPVF